MDLKLFFLTETYFNVEDREMIRMLWEECLPEKYYNYVRRPEIFELLHSPKLTFKQVKDLIGAYLHVPRAWAEIVNCFKEHHAIYQYTYAHLFPKTFTNRTGFAKKIQHKMCFERWQERKRAQERAKNPFNFEIPDTERHPFEQVPITNEITFLTNDDEHKADVPDSRKKTLPPSANKENIPPYPSHDPPKQQRFLYAPTMVGTSELLNNFQQNFDKKHKLPRQKVRDKNLKKAEERKKTKEKLIQQLAENDEKMKIINSKSGKINIETSRK